MRVLLGLFLMLLAGAACGGVTIGGSQPVVTGTVTGSVAISPCRPVERPGDPPCPPRPGVPVHFQPVAGGSAVTTLTDAGGRYRVTLAAGEYEARAEGGIGPGRVFRVSVPKGGTVTLEIVVDSGIR